MKDYELNLNPMQKELLEHAIQFCIDSANAMGAITPKMVCDLEEIRKKIKERGQEGV